MKRYHVRICRPEGAGQRLKVLTSRLNNKSWRFSSHCLENLKYRIVNIENLLAYIKTLKLRAVWCFEHYEDEEGNITKAVYRFNWQGQAIILCINKDKRIISIWANSMEDNHETLRPEQYIKEV